MKDTHKEILAIFGLVLLITVTATVLNREITGPAIYYDETGYLTQAAGLAGYQNNYGKGLSVGYSLLIAPAFMLADSPAEIWDWIKDINTILISLSIIGLWWISREIFPEVSLGERMISVGLVMLYPFYMVVAGYAFTGNAFVTVTVWSVAFLIASHKTNKWYLWALFGVVVALAYWVHVRGLVVVIAAVWTVAFMIFRHKLIKGPAVFMLVLAIMFAAYEFVLEPYAVGQTTVDFITEQSANPTEASSFYEGVTARFFNLARYSIPSLLARTGGHLFYLTLSTLGLVWIGFHYMGDKAFFASKDKQMQLITIFSALAFVGTLAMSVAFFDRGSRGGSTRLDQWFYGRYVEGVLAPILLIGMHRLQAYRKKWPLLLIIGVAIISALLLEWQFTHGGPLNKVNISGFWQFHFINYHTWRFFVMGMSLIGLIALMPVPLLRQAFIGLVFVGAAVLNIENEHAMVIKARERTVVALSERLRNTYEPGTCIGYDVRSARTHEEVSFWEAYGFYLYDYRMARLDVDQWVEACDGPLITYYSLDRLESQANDISFLYRYAPLNVNVWLPEEPNDPIYPLLVDERPTMLYAMMPSEWVALYSEHQVWSRTDARLFLPVPDECINVDGCELVMEAIVFQASGQEPVNVIISRGPNEEPYSMVITVKTSEPIIIRLPLEDDDALHTLIFEIPDAFAPADVGVSNDPEPLGISLLTIDVVEP